MTEPMRNWKWKCPVKDCNCGGRQWKSHARAKHTGNRHLIIKHQIHANNSIQPVMIRRGIGPSD